MQYINFSSYTRSQWAWAEDADLDHHIFRPTIFFQSTFWATSLQFTSFFSMTHSSWRSLSNGCMFLFSWVEQRSAIKTIWA